MQKKLIIIGNPNVGKTSLFNQLTGLNQKVGNYLGVTVDKKIGYFYHNTIYYQIIDIPGTYSIYPSSKDEEIVVNLFFNNEKDQDYPDITLFIADASNIKKSLLLFQQIQDLGMPILLILNMLDEAKNKGIVLNVQKLKNIISTEIVSVNARTGQGLIQLKDTIHFFNAKKKFFNYHKNDDYTFIDSSSSIVDFNAIKKVQKYYKINIYKAWYYLACQNKNIQHNTYLKKIKNRYNIISNKLQIKEICNRYEKIENIISQTVHICSNDKIKKILNFSNKIDNSFFIHPLWGYLIFFLFLFCIFQSIFIWATTPKKLLEFCFLFIQQKLDNVYPGPINNFILHGILPGISMIFTFIPQIVILLFFILLMEETGYINRVIFLMDRLMRPFGLNGKSVVPMMSSLACAIPAILSCRHIDNNRERLITILATPFITCSARLPVYSLIISIIIPDKQWFFFHLRGIVLMVMYLLGFFTSLMISMMFNILLKKDYQSHLIMEMPTYKWPMINNILISLWIHIKSFIFNTGKMILLISVLIWSLGTLGPATTIKNQYFGIGIQQQNLNNSYLGIIGKKIEPLISPLGYDWKIGIGLLSSLIAREVFVSTMATVYSIEQNHYPLIKDKMKKDTYLNTKQPIYNLATGLSLLFFYAFSMQCMSTLSIIKKETKTWKWSIIQFILMTLLAYSSSFIIFHIFKT
ncbi:ferrous iron transport protein B [Blattabacterium cuenoti]|uniref:ferrous iron transport protein B n=1 Tax=Blattabacterium cuenoti TaxID=1653831 RepID=UPI00163CA043|nr:ferrous iron transport protein B [Blattabacterium cuenoti]